MDDGPEPNERLRRSWSSNAAAWTEAVRGGRIRSRRGATDGAVLAAVQELHPERILDVGTGEGWLAHRLARDGFRVVGIDASEALVDAAREGPGEFHVAPYGRLAADPSTVPGPFDVVVCNFSLLGDDLRPLLHALRHRLEPDGHLIVQTVHPSSALGDHAYEDGWREETFAGFDAPFAESMPWFFRTLASWFEALGSAGFRVVRLVEPRVEGDLGPASLLLVCARTEPAGEG